MASIYSFLSTSALEFWAALTALVCVWLAARKNVWNWPVSIASTILYSIVFYDSQLYSDSLLQLVFIGFQIYGWAQWTKKLSGKNQNLEKESAWHNPIHFLSKPLRLTYAFSMIFSTVIWYFILTRLKPNASLPEFDSVIFVISIYAIFLQAKKAMENWGLWIFVNVISVPVYIYKELYFTSAVYFVFIGLAVYGIREWRKSVRVNK
ncbi:MAG: nicotinamide riboside transporter PnuC [Bacteroidetes bacterium]|nr:nicotinamide riboside transporter PnuC [Bacteroidota bacterium]